MEKAAVSGCLISYFIIELFCKHSRRLYKKITPVKREKLIAVLSRLDVYSLIKSNHWWYNPCCPLFIVKWTSGKNEKIEKLSFLRRKKEKGFSPCFSYFSRFPAEFGPFFFHFSLIFFPASEPLEKSGWPLNIIRTIFNCC